MLITGQSRGKRRSLRSYFTSSNRTGGKLQLSGVDVPTCVCNAGVKGSINGIPFHKVTFPLFSKFITESTTYRTVNGASWRPLYLCLYLQNCLPEPRGDLVQQHNPTCWIETYQGGLSCCHHQNILLDKCANLLLSFQDFSKIVKELEFPQGSNSTRGAAHLPYEIPLLLPGFFFFLFVLFLFVLFFVCSFSSNYLTAIHSGLSRRTCLP